MQNRCNDCLEWLCRHCHVCGAEDVETRIRQENWEEVVACRACRPDLWTTQISVEDQAVQYINHLCGVFDTRTEGNQNLPDAFTPELFSDYAMKVEPPAELEAYRLAILTIARTLSPHTTVESVGDAMQCIHDWFEDQSPAPLTISLMLIYASVGLQRLR